MSKKRSLALGILATTIAAALFYVTIRVFMFIRNPNMDFGEGEMAISVGVMVMLGAMFLLVFVAFCTVLFSIGIPHYFLYLKDRHKPTYLYLVKYLSAIPASIYGIWFGIWLISLITGTDPRVWSNLGYSALIGGPFAILFLFTSVPNPKSKTTTQASSL